MEAGIFHTGSQLSRDSEHKTRGSSRGRTLSLEADLRDASGVKRAGLQASCLAGGRRLLCKNNAGKAAATHHLIYARQQAVNRNISDDGCFSSEN